jgi:c-di-GMP-binding flagellar brake protein YcgR
VAKEIKRIEKEFILKSLADNESTVEVHHDTARSAMRLTSLNAEGLTLAGSIDFLGSARKGTEMSVYFRFRGQPMTFTTNLVKREEERITLEMPAAIFRDLSRNYERIVAPEGVSVSIVIEGQEVQLNYPDSDTYEPVEEPTLDSGFDATKISELLAAFRDRSRRFATEDKIVMFRERKPETTEERVIAKSGKILVLPFHPNLGEIRNSFIRDRILTQDDVVAQLVGASDKPVFEALQTITDTIESLNRRNVRHELYCPVLYQRYVVGYLYLMKAGADAGTFDPSAFEFVIQFARVFSYSLKANGYFKAEPVRQRLPAQLLNISGSGVLFSYPPEGPEVPLYATVDMQLHLDQNTLPVRGRVMRKYRDAETTYMGVQFSGLSEKAQRVLFHRLYGPGYDGTVDSRGASESTVLDSDGFE